MVWQCHSYQLKLVQPALVRVKIDYEKLERFVGYDVSDAVGDDCPMGLI